MIAITARALYFCFITAPISLPKEPAMQIVFRDKVFLNGARTPQKRRGVHYLCICVREIHNVCMRTVHNVCMRLWTASSNLPCCQGSLIWPSFMDFQLPRDLWRRLHCAHGFSEFSPLSSMFSHLCLPRFSPLSSDVLALVVRGSRPCPRWLDG